MDHIWKPLVLGIESHKSLYIFRENSLLSDQYEKTLFNKKGFLSLQVLTFAVPERLHPVWDVSDSPCDPGWACVVVLSWVSPLLAAQGGRIHTLALPCIATQSPL